MSYCRFVGAALAAACLAVPAAGIAQQKQVWKASDVHPLGYPTVEAIVRMGKKLEAQTNGRISIQMYPAMQLGVVDGAENNEPTVLAQNHYQVAKIYSLTGHLIIPEMFVFSKRTWDTLSMEDQALLKKLSREAQFEQRTLWDEKTAKATEELKAKGVQFVPADKQAFFKATQPVRDKYGAKYSALLTRIMDTK